VIRFDHVHDLDHVHGLGADHECHHSVLTTLLSHAHGDDCILFPRPSLCPSPTGPYSTQILLYCTSLDQIESCTSPCPSRCGHDHGFAWAGRRLEKRLASLLACFACFRLLCLENGVRPGRMAFWSLMPSWRSIAGNTERYQM
jgi:hypothetical protein